MFPFIPLGRRLMFDIFHKLGTRLWVASSRASWQDRSQEYRDCQVALPTRATEHHFFFSNVVLFPSCVYDSWLHPHRPAHESTVLARRWQQLMDLGARRSSRWVRAAGFARSPRRESRPMRRPDSTSEFVSHPVADAMARLPPPSTSTRELRPCCSISRRGLTNPGL